MEGAITITTIAETNVALRITTTTMTIVIISNKMAADHRRIQTDIAAIILILETRTTNGRIVFLIQSPTHIRSAMKDHYKPLDLIKDPITLAEPASYQVTSMQQPLATLRATKQLRLLQRKLMLLFHL